MYKFVLKNDKLTLENGGEVFSGISAYIELANGKKIPLETESVAEKSVAFSSEQATAKIELREESGVLGVFAKGELIRDRSKSLWMDNADFMLNPNGSFHLNIESLNGLKEYHASTLTGFWAVTEEFGQDVSKIRPRTQAMLYNRGTDYSYIMTACDSKYKGSLKGEEKGISAYLLSLKRGLQGFEGLLFAVSEGKDPYSLPENTVAACLKFLNKPTKLAKDKKYPEILEYLGWCSWDAMPCNANHNELIEKAKEFRQKNIPVRWGIIDDSWTELDGENNTAVMHDRRLNSFKADPKQFPNGLEPVVKELKKNYGLKIGIWHPMVGYWLGFNPEGETAKQLAEVMTKTEDGRTVIAPTLEASFKYHTVFYKYLKQCGADFVKVDCQSSIDWFYKNLGTVGEMSENLLAGIEGAVGIYFGGDMINCMSMANESIWNHPNSLVTRCSNDYLPDNRQWFVKHIMQCSYNCYNYSGLLKGDWDMYWTEDSQGVKNTVLRAVSGGPIYVSDKVGRSCAELLLPATLSDGRILRCNRNAMPTKECLTSDPRTSKSAFKLWNTTDNGYVMAVYNLDAEENPVKDKLSVLDLPGSEDIPYAVYNYFTKELVLLKDKTDFMELELSGYDDYRLFNIAKVSEGFALLGLTGKYISLATFTEIGKGKYILKNGGEVAFYSEKQPLEVKVDGEKTQFTPENNCYKISVSDPEKSHILEFVF